MLPIEEGYTVGMRLWITIENISLTETIISALYFNDSGHVQEFCMNCGQRAQASYWVGSFPPRAREGL